MSDNVVIHYLSHDADLVPEHQPGYQVQQVVDGKLDIAAVWGPFAGYYKAMKHAPLTIQPVNLMEDDVPMEFDMAIAVRRTDTELRRGSSRRCMTNAMRFGFDIDRLWRAAGAAATPA